ncbi:outer membrane beta-barrel protein [Hydrogenivirga sp. 128-5-R1-1]|uniref:outer membrane beta-barrel protein n=1 Tax=Hydrogenivirga sp. 128-5-R1-1 TaxID=392423 RepID=UPI00015F1701|nr:outer membrane beta-barrel protein [Hydrogenivirga sp. 128-5-R1-1]EDP76200.1 hypothetical protein HG1285_18559 [Hydrogenivirga sp. 128-5-R1-1]
MKKKILLTAVLAFAGSSLAQEKTLSLKISQPMELYGAITGGYFYTTNEGNRDSQDAFRLTNVVVGLSGGGDKVSFDLAVGTLLAPSVWDGGVNNSMISYTNGSSVSNEAGILWGYVTLSPMNRISVDVGYLTTNVGAEVINTYANKNITLGAVWYAQPVIYPGVRVNFQLNEDISLYAEYNNDAISPRAEAYAVGSLGSLAGIDYALTYYDYTGFKNFIDVVLGYSLGTLEIGLNLDYQWLDSSAKSSGQDDTAYGLAVFITPSFKDISVPVRFEYFDEGTSGIYFTPDFNGDGTPDAYAEKGFSFTVTPTYKPTENSFVRAELSYVSADNKVFKNGNEDNKTTVAVELGFTF